MSGRRGDRTVPSDGDGRRAAPARSAGALDRRQSGSSHQAGRAARLNRQRGVCGYHRRWRALRRGPAEQLSGQFLADLVFPPAERQAHRQELAFYFATGQGPLLNNRIETVAMHADGTFFPVELAITHIDLRGRMGFTAFLRDLTER